MGAENKTSFPSLALLYPAGHYPLGLFDLSTDLLGPPRSSRSPRGNCRLGQVPRGEQSTKNPFKRWGDTALRGRREQNEAKGRGARAD